MTTGTGTTTPSRPHRAAAARDALRACARRWPTLLGVAVAVASLWGTTGGLEFTAVFFIAAVGYQVMALTTRRSWTWPVALVLAAAVAGLRAAGVDVAVVLGAATVVLAVTALRLRGLRALQTPVALVLVGLAVLAFRVPPEVATAVVAAGLIGHAAWDLVQWRADAVIARSFAEWCGVYDLVLGVGLLLTLVL